ncbi:alpha/beta hydrolase [Mesorhizobium sp. AR02]|uniref:dienelactone hydrolase family protein n=1 Tax=Mesorhizobium sp. AR02 TaxID=2865837 RepID=UPI00215F3BCC|nr:alpha/beta hydrolase [Mesorhizobium sp. AR02]UVK54895.1 alpha/beta hydrolase [Mesorhizobium sp. AR02]
MSRKLVLALVVVSLWLVSQAAHAADPDFDESHAFLHVVIDGKPYRLDSLVVKKSGAKGPLPLALVTHGTAISNRENRAENVEKFRPRARDLALRGWLAVVVIRRGYGRSDGPFPADGCKKPHVKRDLDVAADDLQAVIDVMKRRTDVDSSHIIAMGDSVGGATAIALGARNPAGLVGVISVSGGLHLNCAGWADKLVEAYRTFGATSHVPNLWLYAKNDSYFGPEVVDRLQTSFTEGGANLTSKELDPFQKEGHALFLAGGMQWLEKLDYFLQYNHLPTWSYDDASKIQRQLGLGGGGLRFAQQYLIAPTPKAMSFSPSVKRAFYQYDGTFGLAANRVAAISLCEKAKNTDCSIVMENDRWVGPASQ